MSAVEVELPPKGTLPGGEDAGDGIDNRPPDTPFKQQMLSPLWQPILTPKFVVRTFFLFGLVFCGIGASLLASSGTVEVEVQYDGEGTPVGNKGCQITASNEGNAQGKTCTVELEAPGNMAQPVYLYYKAMSVYQDHRLFVQSRNLDQLLGEDVKDTDLEERCAPEVAAAECQADEDTTCPPLEQPSLKTQDGKYMWPCGNVGMSFFNDVIAPRPGSSFASVWKTTGIAWPGDVDVKFKNPSTLDLARYRYLWDVFPKAINAPCAAPNDGPWFCSGDPVGSGPPCVYDAGCPPSETCARPPRCAEGDYDPALPNTGLVDEHFVNWMRTSARPDFRKLHGIIEADIQEGDKVLVDIVPNFRVDPFGGKKFLVLSTGSWMGGNGTMIGVLYLVFGTLFLSFGTLFITLHRMSPRKLSATRYTFKKASSKPAKPEL